MPYVGRFAPSPTGALHFGSAVAAIASFLQARVNRGEWLVRIDNIDRPREKPGAATAILRSLERLGLQWDRTVQYQRDARAAHLAACDLLLSNKRAFRCVCSRRQLTDGRYLGTCRTLNIQRAETHVVRVIAPADPLTIEDALQGRLTQNIATASGDFVIWRAEDLPAYHLAVVIDDGITGVTEVVRGADLLESTPCQFYLQSLLKLPHPRYLHFPIALDRNGAKLSKQASATAIDLRPASETLSLALAFLGHPVPTELRAAPAGEILSWAVKHWQAARIPKQMNLSVVE